MNISRLSIKESFSTDVLLQIDQACVQFEAACKQGTIPRIENMLTGFADPAHAYLRRELLLLELAYRKQNRETPLVKEYLERFPDLENIPALMVKAGLLTARQPETKEESASADWHLAWKNKKIGPFTWTQVRELAARGELSATDMLLGQGTRQWVKASSVPGLLPGATFAQNRDMATKQHGSPPHETMSEGIKTVDFHSKHCESTAPKPHWPEIPGYEILDELGHGGMGVVFKARQTALKRLVALKMILAGPRAQPEDLKRFRREAEAVARLQHPNIVQIHEISEHEGQPYFCMEFVEGGNLAKKLAKKPQPPMKIAQLVESLARAVQAAHQKGVIHRDLKPANILLSPVVISLSSVTKKDQPRNTEHGTQTIPKITDFGLAKQLDTDDAATRTGAVMGTPNYMSPEQAAGNIKEVGTPTDIYALGVILYEGLTGRPPFQSPDVMETLQQVQKKDPVPPRRLQPKMPRDLETICLKCLRKEPGKRYSSSEALADDLLRFQKGEPIQARPIGQLERSLKWALRRPALASVCVLFFLVVLLGFGGGGAVWLWRQTQTAYEETEQSRSRLVTEQARTKKALIGEKKARKRLSYAQEKLADRAYGEQIDLIHRSWEAGDAAKARKLLEKCDPARRNWEWNYLNHLVHPEIVILEGHTGGIKSVAFSPDSQSLASASSDKTVKVWDLRTGKVTHNWEGGFVNSVAFSPDGKRLAAGTTIWDLTNGRKSVSLMGPFSMVIRVVFSPDGTRLATASDNQPVRVWDAHTGKLLYKLMHTGMVASVAFSPDSQRMATGSWDKTIKIWDVGSGAELHTLKVDGAAVSVNFGPHSWLLQSGSLDNTIRLWNVNSGKEITHARRTRHDLVLQSLIYGPLGLYHACICKNQTVKVYDNNGSVHEQPPLILKGHSNKPFFGSCLASSPEGSRVASGDSDGTIRVWDCRSEHGLLTLMHGRKCLAFSPNGLYLATGSGGNRYDAITLWDCRDGKRLMICKGHALAVDCVTFSPDGKRLASGAQDKQVKTWDARTGKLQRTLEGHHMRIISVAFSPDGSRLASGSLDKTVKVWSVNTGTLLFDLKGHVGAVNCVAFSPDGSRLASASQDKTVLIWDAHSGKELKTLKGHDLMVNSVAFSPEGKRLASGSLDGTARIWDAYTGKELLKLQGLGSVSSVAYSSDGERLATSGQSVMVWNTRTGQALVTLNAKGLSSLNGSTVSFSPDGKRLACASSGVFIWETELSNESRRRRSIQWHQFRAQICQGLQDWSLAAIHYRALSRLDTDTPEWAARRDQVLGKLRNPAATLPKKNPEVCRFVGHPREVTRAILSPNGRFALSCSYFDKSMRLWDVATGNEVRCFIKDKEPIYGLAFSPDGQMALSGGGSVESNGKRMGTIRLWDMKTGKEIRQFAGHSNIVRSVSFSPNGKFAVSGGTTIRLWDISNGKEIRQMGGHIGFVDAVVFSPDGSSILSCGLDKTIRHWDVQSGNEIRQFKGHTNRVISVAYSPDGRQAVSAGFYDKTIRLWDVKTGREIRRFVGHTGLISCATFSPDSRRILSCSMGEYTKKKGFVNGTDQTVRLWDVKTGKEIQRFNGHRGSVRWVVFAPDGRQALSASGDRTIRLWRLPP